MPKLQLDVHQLTDGKVSFISIVKAGANRAPVKVIKSEDDDDNITPEGKMFDFGKIQFFAKTEPDAPVVSAIIVNKDADLEVAKARITAAGFSVEKMETGDTAVVFSQLDEELPEGTKVVVIKFGGDLAMTVANVTGLRKMFSDMNFESVDFGEVLSQEGFFPSIHLAGNILEATVGNIMSKAEDAGEAVTNVTAAVNDYRDFITKMVESIPITAFKLEEPIDLGESVEGKKTMKKADDPAGEGASASGEAGGSDGSDGNKGDGSSAATKEDADANTTGESSDGSGDDGNAQRSAGSDDAGAGDDGSSAGDASSGNQSENIGEAVKAAMAEALGNFRTETTTALKEITVSLATMNTRIGGVEGVAKAAADAIKATVPGEATDDTDDVTKSGENGAPPLLDTALGRVH